MRIISKIVLLLVVLSLLTPFVKSACDLTLLSAVQENHAPMCHMGSLAQSLAHLDHVQQFGQAIVERLSIYGSILLAILVMSYGVILAFGQAHHTPAKHRIRSGVIPAIGRSPLRQAFISGSLRRVDYA